MTNDSEFAEALSIMREAISRDRGYASFFGWSLDRTQAELGVAESFAESLEAAGAGFFRRLRARHAHEDPPDVEAEDLEGRRIAIEVTELVDGEAIKASKAGAPMAYAQWPREKFLARLRERVTEKLARATRLKGGPFPGGYLILIHTDEPLLSSAKVSEYLMGIEHPALKGVARAFLLVSYEPAHARCPYFELASEA